MNFIQTLSSNYESLKTKDVVNLLWREIIKQESYETNIEDMIEYSFHIPVDTEAYLEELHLKFDQLNKESLRVIDGHLKAYLITFLYYCTKNEDRSIPSKTMVMSCSLYFKLITLPGIGKIFFEYHMYKAQLVTCMVFLKDNTIDTSSKIYLIKLLKKYCLQEQLDPYLLKGTANTITSYLTISCDKPVKDIRDVGSLPMYCINALRELILNEDDGSKLNCIMESLFRCLRQCIVLHVSDRKAAVGVIIIFIRDVLQQELDQGKFQYLLEAFGTTWGQVDFDSYEDTIVIMNLLKPEYYKELVRKMVGFTQLKCPKNYLVNVIRLLYEIAKNPPPFALNKIDVLYSCAIQNVLYHFIDRRREVVDEAITLLTELCRFRDHPLMNSILAQFEASGKFVNISAEALFLCFARISDDKWCSSSRNENLLVVFARFLAFTRNVNINLIQETLNALCRDATPTALRSALPIIHELFCVMALKQECLVSRAVLKILFDRAMHQDMASMEYVDHIFRSLLKPSVINGISYSQYLYCNIFMTTHFEYEALFIKCRQKIGPNEIATAVKNLDYREPGSAVLLCCLLDYCDYTEIKHLATYMITHFVELSGFMSAGFICASMEKILTKRHVTNFDFPQLDLIQNLILTGMFGQSFIVPCIKPAFDLFECIRNILRLPKDEIRLNELLAVTSNRAFNRLHSRTPGDSSVFMYLNELCLLLRKLPTENVLLLLEAYMEDPNRIAVLTTYMADIYIQLLTLFTTLAMMKRSKAPLVMRYLHENLENKEKIVKVLSFKLLVSLCQEITHEYEEVIKFALREMVVADPCLVRICAGVLEELIHEDYIKLTSENFFRFVYVVGCSDLKIFMKDLMLKRFLLSNQNDVAKYYISSVVYLNMCNKFPNYPISNAFFEDLAKIKLKVNQPTELLKFLFDRLPMRKKFNVVMEICEVLEDLLRGQCKVDDTFFSTLLHFFTTIKMMHTSNLEGEPDKQYYHDICKRIEKQIVNYDPTCKNESYYLEYENEIKRCTLALLKLLFFENYQMAIKIQVELFDTLMHWIDFVTPEIINYIHGEKGKEYGPYFFKLVQYYKRNKGRLDNPDR